MGIVLGKLSHPTINKRKNTQKRDKLSHPRPYPELDEPKQTKLNALFDEIVDKVSVDYGQNEIQDIKKAVHTILDRLVDRVNERGVFQISRLEPCGSMAEHTAIWKIDRRTGDVFTEFDFLPVLKLPVDAKMVKSECGVCFEIRTLPIDVEVMKRRVDENGLSSKGLTTMRKKLDHLFWREVNTCLVSACDCFTVEFDDKVSWDRAYCWFSYGAAHFMILKH